MSVVEQQWFTTKQAADYMGFSPDWVRYLAQVGELRGRQRTRGGHWRFHRQWLDAHLAGERPQSPLRAAS